MRLTQASQVAKALKTNIGKLESQIDTLLDRIVDSGSTSVIAAYEKKIARLEREKALTIEKLATSSKPQRTLEESFEHALQFLSSPWSIWNNSDLIGKRTVLRLAFLEPLAYSRKEGLRTPNLAFPFKALGDVYSGKCEMAHPSGFEPKTSPFAGQRRHQALGL